MYSSKMQQCNGLIRKLHNSRVLVANALARSNKSTQRRCGGAAAPVRAAAASSSAAAPASIVAAKPKLAYDAIALDMDGTLTKAHIDFVDMRQRTGIPVGDLFVAMESWEEPEEVARAMGVILEIESEASRGVEAMPGLFELLATLRAHDVRVALVTRNTTASVDAFFARVGEEWRGAFDALLTREHRLVKPDPRLLVALADDLGVAPGRLLMVGDSLEDVECGNAAGAASCLIAGGGNEVGAAAAAPPPGAVPTLTVSGLAELNRILLETAPASSDSGGSGSDNESDGGSGTSTSVAPLGWAAAGARPLDPRAPGAPAPGLDFAEYLVRTGALCVASTSYPRMGAAAGGLQACPVGGHTVLHLQCGSGALTKLLASKGLLVVGADADVGAAARRGLTCSAYGGGSASAAAGGGGGGALAAGALEGARAGGRRFDVVLFYEQQATGGGASMGLAGLLTPSTLEEVRSVLVNGGRLCAEAAVPDGEDAAAAAAAGAAALSAAGWRVDAAEPGPPGRVRLVAQAP